MVIIYLFIPENPLKLYDAIDEEHGCKAGKRGAAGKKDQS